METKNVKSVRRSGQQYAELLCDFMFKRLFGSEANKDVLIGFLNMILEDAEIVDVDFIPTEHLGDTEEDRKAVFDISCRCKDGKSFIIEMQRAHQRHFRKRALYYTSYPINEQGRHARELHIKEKSDNPDGNAKYQWDYDLKPVTVVAILNFRFEHSSTWPEDMCCSSYRLREDFSHEVMTDVLRFVFLELGRFNKRIWELDTVFDKWMYLLKHMHEMVEIPSEFGDPLFTRLFLLAEIGKFTAEELKQYKKSLDNMGDYYNTIHTAAEEAEKKGHAAGLAEGFARGWEEGKEEAIKVIAQNLLEKGMSVEDVASITGMSMEDVKAL